MAPLADRLLLPFERLKDFSCLLDLHLDDAGLLSPPKDVLLGKQSVKIRRSVYETGENFSKGTKRCPGTGGLL